MPSSYAAGMFLLLACAHLFLAIVSYARYRRPRVVRCPMAGVPARVAFDALRAAVLLTRPAQVRVISCSLWPERRQCFQGCRDLIEEAADGHRRRA
jgi:hypothetical protein